MLEEGITEAGAISSWVAAATSYSAHNLPLLPFYIFYSMFGFQRVGDLIWAAADQRARGFLIGATAGRTTLGGEGLQHQDGTSHVVAATVPNCRAYDPAFAGEVAVILDHGAREMVEKGNDVFYYVTVDERELRAAGAAAQRTRSGDQGHVLVRQTQTCRSPPAAFTLMGSGAILREVIAAAELLADGLAGRQQRVERHQLQRACSGSTGKSPVTTVYILKGRYERTISGNAWRSRSRSWRRPITSPRTRS